MTPHQDDLSGATRAGTRDYWLDQATIALKYARARPASDLDGYFEAMRDRRRFLKLAQSAR